jgi:LPS O-antigen subunit length determinant protein (WzzB/FepE family)
MERVVEDSMLSIVRKALDRVLEGYPDYPYKKAFINQELRRTLLGRILNQLPNWHPSSEEDQHSIYREDLVLSQEQEIYLQNLIRQEIAYIMQQNAECINRASPEEIDACSTPSHWFG